MAQNISPDRSQSSNLSKQSDESVTIKDNHAVSKRFVFFVCLVHLYSFVSLIFFFLWNQTVYKTKSTNICNKSEVNVLVIWFFFFVKKKKYFEIHIYSA